MKYRKVVLWVLIGGMLVVLYWNFMSAAKEDKTQKNKGADVSQPL